jgi:hypothetical protein
VTEIRSTFRLNRERGYPDKRSFKSVVNVLDPNSKDREPSLLSNRRASKRGEPLSGFCPDGWDQERFELSPYQLWSPHCSGGKHDMPDGIQAAVYRETRRFKERTSGIHANLRKRILPHSRMADETD